MLNWNNAVGLAGVLVLFVSIGGAFLFLGLSTGSPIAYAVLGAVIFVAIASMGAGGVLAIQWISEAKARRQAEVEQARFVENTKENLAIMGAISRVQGGQNVMLLRQAREMQRALPPGPDGASYGLDDYDPAMFDELEAS